MSATFNYGEVLQKSLLFYEAQRSGELPPDNRILWRGNSAQQDGSTVGRDLSGGYYDAGDHVKFAFPLAGALTMLGWGLIEYTDGYIQSNQYDEALDALKWGTDWLLKAHETDATGTTAFWVQVGDGNADHNTWIPPEDMEDEEGIASPPRPAYKLDRQTPGSDVAAEAAAALAAASIVFRPHDAAYADELLENAIQLYAFADDADLNASNNGVNGTNKLRGKYSDAIPDGDDFYNSWSGYPDELLWGATWMHKAQLAKLQADSSYGATTDYLAIAEQQYRQTYFNVGWTQSWDDKSQGAAILLAQLNPQNQTYRNDVERWLNRWLPEGSSYRPTSNAVAYTPGGLAVLSPWGSLRYSANTAFLAGIYADTVLNNAQDANLRSAYDQFAKQQIDYALGANPEGFSYVVGFGNDYPLQPHHRGASHIFGYGDDYNDPNYPNAYVLYGALVGGPKSADDSDYQDLRKDYVANEVALDYNAGFTGAVARLYQQFGGDPIRDEELDNLPDNEDYITYRPHLQVNLNGTTADLAITAYGGTAQNADPQLNIFLDQTAQLIGNGWKKLEINYNVTQRSILQFDFRSAVEGEIQGLGFDSNDLLSAADNVRFFQISGSQSLGLNRFNNYETDSGWRAYSIRLSDFLTGNFKYLVLGNEQDIHNATAESQFRNIELLETQAPTTGTSGTDRLTGSSGNDSFEGLAGNDSFVGSLGDDLLDGGLGVDRVDYASNPNGVRVDLAAGYAQKGSSAGDTLVNIENIYGSNKHDRLIGDDLNNVIVGRKGNDVIHGGAGDDVLRGGIGADVLDGGIGIDTVDYVGSSQGVTVNLSNNSASGGDATGDIISGFERIYGSDQNDSLTGNSAANLLFGRAGDDNLSGGAGNDRLRGDAGNDRLTGGTGADRFEYSTETFGKDTIVDFEDGIDKIVLRGSRLTFGSFTVMQQAANTLLTLNSSNTINTILLLNVNASSISSSDFVS